MNIFIARQPIFDIDYNTKAYELLYRENDTNSFNMTIPGNVATSILLLNSYLNFGLEKLVGKEKAFFNFGSNLIKNTIIEVLDSEKIVIEILEDVIIDNELLERVFELKKLGFSFAIDDLVFLDNRQNLEELIELCDIVKIDFLQNNKEEIKNLANYWSSKGKTLLAEKVETCSVYEWAKTLGFKYFQGYYFSKPTMEKRVQIGDSALQYLSLMKELNNPEPDVEKISSLIEGDVSIAYKLLKMVNVNTKLAEKVLSIKHAIMLLGLKSFRTWLSLVMVQNLSYFKTHELVKIAMIRMDFLKKIASNSEYNKYKDELAFLGTLSVLDGLLNIDMEEIVENLPLNDDLKDTLLNKETKYSLPYQLCLRYEEGDFLMVDRYLDRFDYDKGLLSAQYIDSINWSEMNFKELNKKL